MTLYEFVIIFDGEKTGSGRWKRRPEVLDRGEVLAGNEAEARVTASRMVPESFLGELDRVSIQMRPF